MKKIKDVRAVGYSVLVEFLTQQEAYATNIALRNDSTQGHVRSMGPLLDKKCGLKVGDRVIMQGLYHPVPAPEGKEDRHWGIMDLHNIKAVLEETEVTA